MHINRHLIEEVPIKHLWSVLYRAFTASWSVL